GKLYPHEPVAHALEHGPHDRRHASGDPLLRDQAGVGIRRRPIGWPNHCVSLVSFIHFASERPAFVMVTKKSGSRGNPLSKADRMTSDRYEISKSWTTQI